MKEEKNTNRKDQLTRIGMIVFSLMIGAIGGMIAARSSSSADGSGLSLAKLMIDVLIFCVIMYIQIFIHEGGHLIFGLLSGYKFLSFRIASLMLVKYPEGCRMKKMSIAGTGGQCLLAPPDPDTENPPVMLYNMGGVIANLISALIGAAVYALLPEGYPKDATLIFTIIGVLYAILNGVPLKTPMITNDGYNTLSLRKDPEVRRAFLIQLKINELQTVGVRLKDMPQEWFEVREGCDLHNPNYSTLAVFKENRLIDGQRLEEAMEQIKLLGSDQYTIHGLYKGLLALDDIFIRLLTDPESVEADELDKQECKAIIKQMKGFPSILRIQYAFAGLKEKDQEKAGKILDSFENLKKSYPVKADLESESELIALVEQKL